MNGVLVVDKPGGITSFDVVARVRRALGVRRVGHTGTLDPMATGVLPICVGEATKLVPFLMGGDKVYEAEACFGVTTDTLDATGVPVAERDPAGLTEAAILAILPCYLGTILQQPPMHSALRQGGRRLYELARQGLQVDRAARPVRIDAIELLAWNPPRLRLRVRCGKGTYIRSLVDDLGAELGPGAHLSALRRTLVGPFTLAEALPIEEVDRATPLLPLAGALADHATVMLEPSQVREVREGKLRTVASLRAPEGAGEHVRLLAPDGSLVAVAAAAAGQLTLARVFC